MPLAQPLPPGLVVRRQRHVGEQRVAADHLVGVAVGFRVGPRHHAEVARFRIDRPQPPVLTRMQPRDVITHGVDAPAGQGVRRDQHRKIGLAAGGRERARHVVRLAARTLEPHDQHVLGEPAFAARLPAGDAQRVTLLAQQRVAAVARAEALDREFLGEVHDEAPLGVEFPDRVQPAHETAFARNTLERRAAGTRHDQHIEHDVGAVGDLHTAARQRRVDRTHAIGDHVQRALAHAAAEQLAHLGVRLARVHPVVVRAGVFLRARADIGQMLDPCHVIGRRAGQVAARELFRIQALQFTALHQLRGKFARFRVRALAPVQGARLRQLTHGIHPLRHGTAQLRKRDQRMCSGSHPQALLFGGTQ